MALRYQTSPIWPRSGAATGAVPEPNADRCSPPAAPRFCERAATSGHGNSRGVLRVGPRVRERNTGARGKFRNASPSFALRSTPGSEDTNNALILVTQ